LPWKRALDLWNDPLSVLTDATIVAAGTNRHDAVATFDFNLSNKLQTFASIRTFERSRLTHQARCTQMSVFRMRYSVDSGYGMS